MSKEGSAAAREICFNKAPKGEAKANGWHLYKLLKKQKSTPIGGKIKLRGSSTSSA